MFDTKIIFKGKECTVRFGSWVMGEIEKLAKKEFGNIEMFANLIFFGLIQGEGLRNKYLIGENIGFDIFDCYDWIDEVGGLNSAEVQKINKLFVASNETNVPKNLKATKSDKDKEAKTSIGIGT